MKTAILKYNVFIRKEGKYFVAYTPTLGISDYGKTVNLAKKHIQDAIVCHIEGLIKTKSELPTPDTEEFYISQVAIPITKNFKFAF